MENFSKDLFLMNRPIKIEIAKQQVDFIPPKVSKLFDRNFMLLVNFIEKRSESYKELLTGVDIDNFYDFLIMLGAISREEDSEGFRIYNALIKELTNLIPSLEVTDLFMKVGSGLVTKKDFMLIEKIILISLDREKEDIKEQDTLTEKEREMKEMVERIKRNSKKSKENNEEAFNKMLVAIIYHFPQYKLEDLFDLNIYTLYFLFKQVGKISNYEVGQIAAGNGLMKDEFKHFIDK